MNVLMPQLGETLGEGTIAAWFKGPGDAVKAGETLFEIETDKTAMEVQALASGIVAEIRVPAGCTVAVGAVVAVIDDDKVRKPGAGSAAARTDARAAVHERPYDPFNEVRTPAVNFGPARRPDGLRVTPLARRLITQNGFDADAVAAAVRRRGGSKITARDLAAVFPSPLAGEGAAQRATDEGSRDSRSIVSTLSPPGMSAGPHPSFAGANDTFSREREKETPEISADHIVFNRIRRETGRRLVESWCNAPHVLQAMEIDFTHVTQARAAHKEAFAAHGLPLTFLPFIARAACLAIADFPQVNAVLDGDGLTVVRDVHLGIAVDLGHNGLVVPVVRHADGMSVAGLAAAIHRQIVKARAGRLTPDDLDGGTYTISNNGSFGTLFTAPIINAPQVAILSTDAIRKRPVVVETEVGDVIMPRSVGIVAQSFDHRAFDGAYSAAFLSCLKDIVERRGWLSEFA